MHRLCTIGYHLPSGYRTHNNCVLKVLAYHADIKEMWDLLADYRQLGKHAICKALKTPFMASSDSLSAQAAACTT